MSVENHVVVNVIRTREELTKVAKRAQGFLYNDFGGSDPAMCPVHTLTCTWLDRMLDVKPGPLSVKKAWSDDLDALLAWINARGKQYSLCSRCRPRPSSVPPRAAVGSPSTRTPAPVQADDGAPTFYVRCPTPGNAIVEVWSAARLPFEPKGEQLVLRKAIREAVRKLPANEGQLLHALYTSEDASPCDAENVLIYNVGPSTFAYLAGQGICFERSFGPVPRSNRPLNFNPRHYCRYSQVTADAPWVSWMPAETIASFEADLPASGDHLKRPEKVWHAVRSGRVWVASPRAHLPVFGLTVDVAGPASALTRPAELLKPIIDGIVAAFHAHDGSQAEECSTRVARDLGASPEAIQEALLDDERAVLGVRRLLWPRAQGVQWNPADDLCVAGVLRVHGTQGPCPIRLAGNLVALQGVV